MRIVQRKGRQRVAILGEPEQLCFKGGQPHMLPHLVCSRGEHHAATGAQSQAKRAIPGGAIFGRRQMTSIHKMHGRVQSRLGTVLLRVQRGGLGVSLEDEDFPDLGVLCYVQHSIT